MHIGFEPDNHRLVDNAETLHFISRHAHYHGLACADFMPADAAVVLLYHPNGIFLRGIEAVVWELLECKAGESLRRSVVGRANIAVEAAVVLGYKPVTDRQGLAVKPVTERGAYFLYLGGCLLYCIFIGDTGLFAVDIHLFCKFGHGVLERIDKHILAVAVPHGIGVVGDG